jgi:adenylate cyclase class 2
VIENELKIPVEALGPIRDRLRRLGAEPLSKTRHEANILFDTADSNLRNSGQVLRLRRVGDQRVLTFKGHASFDGPVKQRLEIEVEVSSAEATTELLRSLGFAITLRYEKFRESWRLNDVHIDLDRTPIGSFIEVEGPPGALGGIARRLGLDPDNAISESYIGLWLEHRRRHPELGRDMVFEPC